MTAGFISAVSAANSTSGSAGVDEMTMTTVSTPATDTSTEANASPMETSDISSSSTNATTSTKSITNIASSSDVFANLKTQTHPSDSYHMPTLRVIHARVQSDAPILVDGVFVSSFGGGELDAGYLSAMDTVNTASVEGALMYVQAEGINVKVRAEDERCERKSSMANIVFYEIILVQTNETLAQFQDSWGKTPEYGPMLPMDSGRCTPLSGDDDFPAGCLQFNGDEGQPNVGPFIGAGIKDDDVRAPYPDNYWFSFPGSCPLKVWAEKTDECREKTRKGLCNYGEGPDGVECTFTYNIMGWVTIDDIVGITAIENPETGSMYANFTEWCLADSNNIEFSANAETGEFETGLPFWKDPLNSTANAARAEAVIATYKKTLSSGSTQIDDSVVAVFRALPTPEELAASNPPCYMTVEACGSGNGCKRVGYSQICTECEADEGCETSGSDFVYPKLEKAYTDLSENETTTKIEDGNSTGATGSTAGSTAGSSKSSSAAPTIFTLVSVVVGLMTTVFAL
ncbi:unnamed protein product [Peronospora belbahrii]|uniref:Uncharacterized protein n=1 Tax=Peronospora belbahrii TaxID=622444 RepID=A0ABN8CZ34_9STRA|nr:unnamed protein product [Peronospora belbahrii]